LDAQPDLPRLCTAKDICAAAQITERHLWRMIAQGRFPSGFNIGRRRLWHPDDVNAFWKKASAQARKKKEGN
jgi:predicted DNA-binding transcriptional regulator AlpA